MLTTSGQLLIERGRGNRERQAEDRRHARQLRLAVRLVMEELAESLSLIETAARSRRYWIGPRYLPTATWSEYRTEIAGIVESALDWRRITGAYDAINDLNWVVDHRRRTSRDSSGPTRGFWIEPVDGTRDAWLRVRLALETLEGSLGISREASRAAESREVLVARLWPFGDASDFDRGAAEIAALEGERDEMESRWRAEDS